MTRRGGSLLRRVAVLEDRAAKEDAARRITAEDLGAALSALRNVHLLRLEALLEEKRPGFVEVEGVAYVGGPDAVALLGLPEDVAGADLWARAYFAGSPRPALPEDAPEVFAAHAFQMEDTAEDLEDGEERRRLEEGAALWSCAAVLARVLLEVGKV